MSGMRPICGKFHFGDLNIPKKLPAGCTKKCLRTEKTLGQKDSLGPMGDVLYVGFCFLFRIWHFNIYIRVDTWGYCWVGLFQHAHSLGFLQDLFDLLSPLFILPSRILLS